MRGEEEKGEAIDTLAILNFSSTSGSLENDKDNGDDEDDQEDYHQGSNHTSQHWTNEGLGGGGRG